ncbi:DUF4230 domain-containing protein [Neobacillus jeddahensis]|uniref:DUF4230 domain-containing protein n=1 Tax=Neobacillus jeddahensis TaxID=1461580 RepID=UPI00058FE286|nr:DUF4230 domain-containing protein [Neobacillus jeddahensis]
MEKEKTMSKSELEDVIRQLQQAQKQTASTIALQPARSWKLPRLFSIKPWFIGIIMGIVLTLAAWFTWHSYFQKAETMKSATAVESIQKLATLTTAQAHMKTIISKEDNKLFGKTISFNFPGSKRTLFLVVPGDVTAGVDVKDVKQKDVSVDADEKIISITLPHATIGQDPSLDFDNIQTFSTEGLFRSDADWDEGFELADLAKQNIKDEAIDSGLLKTAEENAALALKDFFKNLGYTVNVTFK